MLVDVISHILPTLLAGPSNSLWKHHGLKAVTSRTVYPTGLLFISDIREDIHHQAGGFNRIIHVYSVKGNFPVMKGTQNSD